MDSILAAGEATAADLSGSSGRRRSCHFCRLRKIRCSGHGVCEACRARNIDCVYANEAFSSGRQTHTPHPNQHRAEMLNDYASPGPSLPSTVNSPSVTSEGMGLLCEELESVSQRLFIPGHTIPSAELDRSSYWHGAVTREPAQTGLRLPYREVFVGLAQAIVELFLLRFDSLGCSPREQTALADLSRLFFQYQGPIAFASRAPHIPQLTFSDLKVQQLVDIWFAQHPLSFVLSKTLLLQSYRNGTHDFDLLALVLADASYFLGSEDLSVSQAMFEAARARVLERSALSLSTIQALILLGWHDFCFYHPRHGYCYLELARVMATEYLSSPRQPSPTDHYDSGISIHAIEIELAQRIYWFTACFTLWLSLHQSSPDLDVFSTLDMTTLPPADVFSSPAYVLDEGSTENMASLVAQTASVRELWSLAHITCTVAPLLELRLEHGSNNDNAGTPHQQILPYWNQSVPPQPLQPTATLAQFRALLLAAIARLPKNLDHTNPSQVFTLAALHIIAIGTAFPPSTSYSSQQQQLQHEQPRQPAGPGVSLADVVRSMQAFLAATRTLARQAALMDMLGGRADHEARRTAWVVLGLDVCGRALARVVSSSSNNNLQGSPLLLPLSWQGHGHGHGPLGPGPLGPTGLGQQGMAVLAELARRLCEVSGEERLRNESGLPAARERLQAVVHVVGGVPPLQPGQGRRPQQQEGGTMPNAPVLSTSSPSASQGAAEGWMWASAMGPGASSAGGGGGGSAGGASGVVDDSFFGGWGAGGL